MNCSAIRPLVSAAGLLAALAVSMPLCASIQVIYTKINLNPTAQIPGPVDLTGAAASSEWKGLESLVMSPGGGQWLIKGRTNLGSDLEHIVVIGSGTTGRRLVQEGELCPGGAPTERYEFFGGSSTSTFNPIGRFDEAGRFAFSGRARSVTSGSTDAVNGQRIFMWDGVNFSALRKQNDPYTGVFDLAAQPGGGAPGNEFSGNNLNSVHLLNNGTFGYCDSQIGGVAFTMRPANFYNGALFHQAGGADTVIDLPGTGTATFAFSTGIPVDRFNTTPDGAHSMFTGTIAGTTTRNVLVLDGRVIVQNGTPASPGIPNTGTITNFELLPDGHWFAWGTYAAQAGFWCLKDGALLAKTGDPITAGSGEHWGNTIYGATGNRLGDYVIAGSTDAVLVAANEVLVLNSTSVLAREGDMVDLNNDGLANDNAFVGRGSPSGSAFTNKAFGVSDDKFVYFFVNMHDSSGADLQSPSFFGDPNAFVRIGFAPACPVDFNHDNQVNPDDLGDYITCFFSEPPCNGADFNHDNEVNPDDLGDYITAYFGPPC